MKDRLLRFAVRYGRWAMAAIFVVVAFTLMNAKHSAFNTLVYDFARFSQAIWNTLHGRFLFETIKYGSILGNHFSPIMALASPFVVLCNSERVLFLIQAINVAATGLILHELYRHRQPDHPLMALAFLLAFYLNPAVHDITLSEVRRIVFGMPFLALGLYGLGTDRRHLMLLGLLGALLAKESVGLFIAMVGFNLLTVKRDRRWGLGLMALGTGWLLIISLWVIPMLSATQGHNSVYPQLYYFDHLGGSYGEILGTILRAPIEFARQILGPMQLRAIGRILLPMGVALPFLAPSWVLICVPFTGLMFASSSVELVNLNKWYTAALVPVLFSAVAVGWERLPVKRKQLAMAWFLLTTLIGYAQFSQAPLGGRYDAAIYDVTAHDSVALKLLKTIPANAKVAAQVHYTPHLALREDIYHYPWIRIGEDAIEIFVLDRKAGSYPLNDQSINEAITNKVSDPSLVVAAEADGFYILSAIADQWPAYHVGATTEEAIYLDRVEIAMADDDGIYRNTIGEPISLQPEQQLRVTLYWHALAAPEAERTVSVRVADASGALAAQHDGLPGETSKPTSWWQAGWQIRDVHYMTLSPGAAKGAASLNVLLYDTYSLEIVPIKDSNGTVADVLQIVSINVE